MSKTNSVLTLNHLALSVKDLDTSIGFYQELFDLQEITNRTEVEGVRWLSLGEGKELHLISIVKDPVSINKAVHFAFTTPDFDAFLPNCETCSKPIQIGPETRAKYKFEQMESNRYISRTLTVIGWK